MKQNKTPLQKLIDHLQEVLDAYEYGLQRLSSLDEVQISTYKNCIVTATSLLPEEREVIEKAYYDGDINGFYIDDMKKVKATYYFDKTFTNDTA